MCTSIIINTEDNNNILARTLDLSENIYLKVTFIPRNYTWINESDNSSNKTKYALIGMASKAYNHPIFSDGVNEKGLTCASLYLNKLARFNKNNSSTKINIVAYNFVLWVLSKFQSLDEVIYALKNINLVGNFEGINVEVPYLHWILSDKSSKSIVIEKTCEGLQVYDNPIGVLTNSPDFNTQVMNLYNYVSITPYQKEENMWGALKLQSLSEGTGGLGLPGDFTSQSRFVRAAFLRNIIESSLDEVSGIINAFKILSNCTLLKGTVINNNTFTYSRYTCGACSESCTYYYSMYESNEINAISLFKEDLNSDKIKLYDLSINNYINYKN